MLVFPAPGKGNALAKEGIGSFLLDCHLDDDLAELEADFGIKGFGVIVRIWQKIHDEKGYYCEWKERSPSLFLSNWFGGNSGVDIGLINEVINKAIKIGIFNEHLYKEYSILTSVVIQDRYLCAAKRRKKVELIEDYLLLDVGNFKENVYIIKKSVNANKENVDTNQTSKVKESKVKESKDIVPASKEAKTAPKEFVEGSFEIKCVDILIKSCQEQFANSKVPISLEEKQKWAVEIDRMRRLDKISDEQILQGIKYATSNSFWKSNIRSAGKFREKFETLYIQSCEKKNESANKFSNFKERSYDMDDLERKLVQGG